jgi:hypothetical protein
MATLLTDAALTLPAAMPASLKKSRLEVIRNPSQKLIREETRRKSFDFLLHVLRG